MLAWFIVKYSNGWNHIKDIFSDRIVQLSFVVWSQFKYEVVSLSSGCLLLWRTAPAWFAAVNKLRQESEDESTF